MIAGLVQLPAVGVLAAAVLVTVAFAHRAAVAWSLLLASIVLGPLFGATLGVPACGRDLSPFTHVPKVPAVPFDAGPTVGLLVALILLASAGFAALRHRDLHLPA